MSQTFMKEKQILPLVISMSLPMVISMAVNSLYNIVDSYFVAIISEDAMTALSLVYPLQYLMTALGVGFGVGMNVRIAFCLGAGDPIKANQNATTGIVLSFIHGVILMFVELLLMPHFLALYTDNSEIIDMGLVYSNRAFLFSVIIMFEIAFEKVFQAVGKMKVSMISMSLGFITNIVLDPLMIFGIGPFPEMGIAGAAWATGIGQSVCLIAYLLFLKISPIPVNFGQKYISFDRKLLGKLYSVGIPATLNMALPSLLISSLNAILAAFSAKYVLVLGAYYKLQTFIYLTANGVIQGIRPLISYNYGAGEYKRVQKILTTSLTLTASVMAGGVLLSYLIPGKLIGLFTSSADSIAIGTRALHIISIGFVFSAVSITICGVLEGLGMGMRSFSVAVMRCAVIIIPAAYLLSRILGADGVFVAFPVAEIITAGAAYLIYKRSYRLHL